MHGCMHQAQAAVCFHGLGHLDSLQAASTAVAIFCIKNIRSYPVENLGFNLAELQSDATSVPGECAGYTNIAR